MLSAEGKRSPANIKEPVIIAFPFTSSFEFGVLVPIPTFVPLSYINPVVSVVGSLNFAR